MDHFPVEIWSLVLSFACTDDGTTGCSLSRVSKDIREALVPFRFQSIALAGIAQITAFIDVLVKSPSRGRRVYHLFICDTPRSRIEPVFSRYARLQQIASPEWNSVLCQVLTIIAPSLRTFVLCMHDKRAFLLSPIALPVLEELSVYGDYYPDSTDITDTVMPFRGLSRLHIHGTQLHIQQLAYAMTSDVSDGILPQISRLAPSLTHFSACNDSIFNWDYVLNTNSETAPGEEGVPYFLPTVERIIFRPLPWRWQRWGPSYEAYKRQSALLNALAGKDLRHRLVILQPWADTELEKSVFEEAWTNWLDGVAGTARRWKDVEELHLEPYNY